MCFFERGLTRFIAINAFRRCADITGRADFRRVTLGTVCGPCVPDIEQVDSVIEETLFQHLEASEHKDSRIKRSVISAENRLATSIDNLLKVIVKPLTNIAKGQRLNLAIRPAAPTDGK